MKPTTWCAIAFALVLAGVAVAQTELDKRSPGPPASAEGPTLAGVESDVAELRADVRRLQHSLDYYMRTVLTYHEAENDRLRFKVRQLTRERDFLTRELEDENERLRRHVRQLYRDQGLALPPVPTPDRELIEELLRGPAGAVDTPPGSSSGLEGAPVPSPFTHEVDWEVVAQWGRTPEEAAALDGDVASLKGMICYVPPHVDDQYLTALGRTIRSQLDPYDNINVEVFDDPDAARSFHENHVAQPRHRVLSISKHAASGRDVILRIRGDSTEVIPYRE